MIKYNNNNTIYDWYFDTSNLIKVYRNNAVCYYKVAGSSPTAQTPCFAVVDDITQYHDTEFVDVFDNATEKWYKLNNLNQFEEYGIYASGRTECQSAPSRLPSGYTELVDFTVPMVHDVYGASAFTVPNNLQEDYKYTFEFTPLDFYTTSYYGDIVDNDGGVEFKKFGICKWDNGWGPVANRGCISLFNYRMDSRNVDSSPMVGKVAFYENSRTKVVTNLHNYTLGQGADLLIESEGHETYSGTSTMTWSSATIATGIYDMPLFSTINGNNNNSWYSANLKFHNFKVETSGGTAVYDYVPCKRDSDNKVGVYDIVNNAFYAPSAFTLTAGEEVTPQQDCVTTYKGKLTIDGDYEYEWNGNSWNNLGEITGSSKTNNFTIEDIGESGDTSNFSDGDYVVISFKNHNNPKEPQYMMSYYTDGTYNRAGNFSANTGSNTITPSTIIDAAVWKLEGTATANTYYIKNVNTGEYFGYQNTATTNSFYLVDESQKAPILLDDYDGAIGLIEMKQLAGSYFGGYGLNQLYGYTYQLNWLNNDSGSESDFYTDDGHALYTMYKVNNGAVDYPKYYADKSEPENYVTFDTMEEALAYECPWVGMVAFIDGERYTFDSTNTWVKVLEYYKVEDVTPNAASGWTITQSATYNPNSSYYDDFDLETTSTSNSYKVAKVTIFGYEDFTYYLRTSGYSSDNFVVATNVDELSTDPTSISYNDPRAITNTFSWNKAPKSAVNLSNYRRVTYNNLDKNVEHTFYVIFYGRTRNNVVGNATILIPKDQTNENWEQVTFSASTNVSGTSKNLYIDGNNSTSGGTNYFYRRWIVGLPSGSHTSYTNYSNYNYCPSVSSATFTSVAGDVRSVNYIYDSISNKTLQIRLVDNNSNVLTPSETVYYTLYKYNACNISTNGTSNYPRSESMPIGGKFRFTQSSNRHYIYGYQLQTALNTDFYTDNYNSTFDIVYSKLNDEAVTITYVTYDPNDAETPAFETKVTWPYNGGTTSSTTLTSCDIPYTYSYTVSQTSNMFSANSQTFTAGQAARTVTFTLYPNNREFASVADMEAYLYAWEGMKATVNGTKYKYENGEWVENTHSLPDVPFSVNYNAKTYNATTKTFAKTEGQLVDVDVTITAGTPTLHDTYVTVVVNTRGVITGYQNYFNRDNSNPNITIVSKLRTDGTYCHVFANRDSNYNWMYRPTSSRLAFHGSSQIDGTSVTTQPVIESIRVDSNRLLRFNNYTDNTTTTSSNFSYGNINTGGFAFLAGYANNTGEWFQGDFYWIYMSQTTLTDEQIQQVIDYNENL